MSKQITREHFNRDITAEELVLLLGKDVLDRLEAENCDYTNRVSADLDCNNEVEFSATISVAEVPEWGDVSVTAYYYQDKDEAAETDDLGSLDWEIRHIRLS